MPRDDASLVDIDLAAHLNRPPLTVLLGPAGAGKTAECLRRFRAAQGRALLVVPSRPQAMSLREALEQREGEAATGGVMTFGDLIAALTSQGGRIRTPIRRTFQRLVLADLFGREIEPTDYFGKMRDTSGFIGALAECIRDLKLSGVTPDDLEAGTGAAAERLDDPSFARKVGEIVRLYRAYEAFLRAHDLCDEEDLPLLAVKAASDAERLRDVDSVLVDGFYRFSYAWRDLLGALALRGLKVVVTLPYDAVRPLLFATPARTLDTLRDEFTVETISLSAPPPNKRRPTLHTLERGLFAGGTSGWRPPEPEESSALLLYDAPNPHVEVEMVARALRREHDERETPWSKCAIFLRTLDDYAPILSGVCEKYGVPLALQQAQIVAEHPLIRTITTLLRVFVGGWQRDDVIAFLKSSFTHADKLHADSLRRRAQRRGLREGRDGWERLAAELEEIGDSLAGILALMLEWDTELMASKRTADEYAERFGSLLTEFDLEPSPRRGPQASPEEHALEQARIVLNDVALSHRLRNDGPMRFTEFYREVTAAWLAATYVAPPEQDAVAVLEPYDACQRTVSFAVVMGLIERIFPRRVNEDPFFRDDERAALASTSDVSLESQRDRADDERLLFYLAVTAPTERLILSFPRADAESDTLPSFYLDEVRTLFETVPTETRTLADVAPRPEECVTPRDRLLADCARLSDRIEFGDTEGVETERAAIYATRLRPRLPRLDSETLRQAYAAPRRYSITELETYNTCPFQHFMKYGLRLRPEQDGGGAADKGTLYHAVLRRHFRRKKRQEDATLEPPGVDETRRALQTELEECLGDRPIDARPYRRRMMERSLSDALSGFAERDNRFGNLFGFSPVHFEMAFGVDEVTQPDDDEAEPDDDRDYDPASTTRPLMIASDDGSPPIALCGVIDRVDLADDGHRALVMDYKLGNSVVFPAIREGRSLQMSLYLLALEQLWGKVGAVACYDSPRDQGRRRFFRTEHVEMRKFAMVVGVESGRDMVKPVGRDEYADTVLAAKKKVRDAVAGITAPNIIPTPGDHCRFCDFGDICRTTRDNAHDGEPMNGISNGRTANASGDGQP